MRRLAAAAILLVAPVVTWAGALDLSLGSETANLVYIFNNDPLNRNNTPTGDGGSELGVGVFFNEDGANLFHATLLARGYRQSASSQYQISAGVKLLGGNVTVENALGSGQDDDETVGALALGFQAGLLLLSGDYNPVDLTFEGFYAPSITSFADAERYGEISVKLQVEIITRARAYIGYRSIRVDTNDFDDINVDRNALVGLNISF